MGIVIALAIIATGRGVTNGEQRSLRVPGIQIQMSGVSGILDANIDTGGDGAMVQRSQHESLALGERYEDDVPVANGLDDGNHRNPAADVAGVSERVEPLTLQTDAANDRNAEYGVEQWRSLVGSIFPAAVVDRVLAIMNCESRGDPNAIGAAGERGVMQIHGIHLQRILAMGYSWNDMLSPEPNLKLAYAISSGGTDWSPWTCQ